jgi:hypothetical protein
MFRLLVRVAFKSIGGHFLFPVLVVSILESIWHLVHNSFDFDSLQLHWEENWVQLLFHGAAFALIVMWVANERLAVTLTRIGALDEYLEDATHYFAIATIRLPEWFQPATQVYFSKILSYQRGKPKGPPSFHQRVMLFFGESDLEATKNTAFDQHPADCFNEVHALNRIPLGYLDRRGVFASLAKLNADQRAALKWCRWYVAHLPSLLDSDRWKWVPSWAVLRRPPGQLAFAVVTFPGNRHKVIQFIKRKRDLEIRKVEDEKTAQAYIALAGKIRHEVFPLTHETSFHYFLHHTEPEVTE